MLLAVERVFHEFPQAHTTVTVWYLGWMPAFTLPPEIQVNATGVA
jgi:hypothetical protein